MPDFRDYIPKQREPLSLASRLDQLKMTGRPIPPELQSTGQTLNQIPPQTQSPTQTTTGTLPPAGFGKRLLGGIGAGALTLLDAVAMGQDNFKKLLFERALDKTREAKNNRDWQNFQRELDARAQSGIDVFEQKEKIKQEYAQPKPEFTPYQERTIKRQEAEDIQKTQEKESKKKGEIAEETAGLLSHFTDYSNYNSWEKAKARFDLLRSSFEANGVQTDELLDNIIQEWNKRGPRSGPLGVWPRKQIPR